MFKLNKTRKVGLSSGQIWSVSTPYTTAKSQQPSSGAKLSLFEINIINYPSSINFVLSLKFVILVSKRSVFNLLLIP